LVFGFLSLAVCNSRGSRPVVGRALGVGGATGAAKPEAVFSEPGNDEDVLVLDSQDGSDAAPPLLGQRVKELFDGLDGETAAS